MGKTGRFVLWGRFPLWVLAKLFSFVRLCTAPT
jgi:hypothetical protein